MITEDTGWTRLLELMQEVERHEPRKDLNADILFAARFLMNTAVYLEAHKEMSAAALLIDKARRMLTPDQ